MHCRDSVGLSIAQTAHPAAQVLWRKEPLRRFDTPVTRHTTVGPMCLRRVASQEVFSSTSNTIQSAVDRYHGVLSSIVRR